MNHAKSLILGLVGLLIYLPVIAAQSAVLPEIIHEHSGIDQYATNVFATPVAIWKERIFVVGMLAPEGKPDGTNHRTMIWEGKRTSHDSWAWQSEVIDDHTLADRYHTQPSVGIDRNGYLHIAYNMHNMPWQYVVSKRPADIRGFEFRGQRVVLMERRILKHLNKSRFRGMGEASIPGNQVTYPAFFNDRKGRLYLTYRYALYPNRPFRLRTFSSAIATYDESDGKWTQIGGCLYSDASERIPKDSIDAVKTCPFASREGWTAYPPRMWFDISNTMYLGWLWRDGIAGADGIYPSYAYRPDGETEFRDINGAFLTLPVTPGRTTINSSASKAGDGKRRYHIIIAVTASRPGSPVIMVSEYKGSRFLYEYDQENGWQKSHSPYGSTAIIADRHDHLWAVGTGPVILSKSSGGRWKVEYKEEGWCYPKLYPHYASRSLYLHVQSCDYKRERVYLLKGIEI